MHLFGYTVAQQDVSLTSTPKPSARSIALNVYQRIMRGEYLQPTIQSVLAHHPRLSVRERAVVYDLCFGTARHDFLLLQRVNARLPDPEKLPLTVRLALRLAAYELLVKRGAAHGVVNAWVHIVKMEYPRLANVANAVLRSVSQDSLPTDPAAYSTTEQQIQGLGMPAFIVKSFRRSLSNPALVSQAIFGMRLPAPSWVSVYSYAGEQAANAELTVLQRVPPTGYPASLAVQLGGHLEHTEVFQAGHVQPQNPASLELVRLAALPGGTMLDVASGHGIKAAGFAMLGMHVVAAELHAERSAAGEANTKRLNTDVKHVVADATMPIPALRNSVFNRVVVDAPCSGTGTLRGNPEILFRFRREHVAELAAVQLSMLQQAAFHVPVGGQLWYAVCSLMYEESDGCVAQFLAETSEFTVTPITSALPTVPGAHGVYVLPEDGRDGFYYACLTRTKERHT